jgi:hypothetical protein
MKRVCYGLCFVFFIALLAGCGIKAADNILPADGGAEDTQLASDTNRAETAMTVLNPITEAASGAMIAETKLPEPDSDSSVQWECGTYYSNISVDGLQNFFQELKEDGWRDYSGNELSTELSDGVSEYMLTKGKDLLQIMVFLEDRKEAICNSILIRKDYNLPVAKIRSRENALSKEEAMEEIRRYTDRVQNTEEFPYERENLVGVFEIFIEGAFDKMELQAYAAISDFGFYGCFLIRKGFVSYIGGDLNNACVADIDADGQYELVDVYTVWESGITRFHLMAYTFIDPLYYNSPAEILQVKYANSFVPKEEYRELFLEKVDDTSVKLTGNNEDYGLIRIEEDTLVVDHMEKFPFDEWARYYSQDILKGIDKVIPEAPPEIKITIDGTDIGYTVRETDWNGTVQEYTLNDAYNEIIAGHPFIPTFRLGGMIEHDISRAVIFDFGKSIPDSVLIYDAMLHTDGGLRYGERLIQKQIFKIVDESHIQFDLKQHMSYFLSSNSQDYQRDWYRLFRVVCRWGENECTYAFLFNTGSTEILEEPSKQP